MTNPDLTYKTVGFFTAFFPETKQGEIAWRTIADQTDGTGKVFNSQAAGTIAQLRKAGYSVHKAPKPQPLSDSDYEILAGLSE